MDFQCEVLEYCKNTAQRNVIEIDDLCYFKVKYSKTNRIKYAKIMSFSILSSPCSNIFKIILNGRTVFVISNSFIDQQLKMSPGPNYTHDLCQSLGDEGDVEIKILLLS